MARFKFDTSQTVAGGRVTVYREPRADRVYCLGFDTANGLDGDQFDSDAAVILDQFGEQVAVAVGHWGESFDQVLKPLCDWYWPFIVGERKTLGLVIMRSLLDAGYWLYFDRDESKRGRPVRDVLGHGRGRPLIPILQRAIGMLDSEGRVLPPRIILHDEETWTQVSHYQFRSRNGRPLEEMDSEHMTYGAPEGEHDDLCIALALAVFGSIWLPHYPRPEAKFPAGTLGEMLGHAQVMEPADRTQLDSRLARAGRRSHVETRCAIADA